MQSNEFLKKNFQCDLSLAIKKGNGDKYKLVWNFFEGVRARERERGKRNKSPEIFESSRIKSEKSHSTKQTERLYSLWPPFVWVVLICFFFLLFSLQDYFAPILFFFFSLLDIVVVPCLKPKTSQTEKEMEEKKNINANPLNYDF